MELEHTHIGKMESRLRQWGSKLDALAAKAEKAGVEANHDYQETLDSLKAKYQAAKWKFDKVRIAGTENLDSAMADFERAWSDLENGFKKLNK